MGAEHRTAAVARAHAALHQAIAEHSTRLEDERKLADADVKRNVPDDKLEGRP